jgi:hypothetical protein
MNFDIGRSRSSTTDRPAGTPEPGRARAVSVVGAVGALVAALGAAAAAAVLVRWIVVEPSVRAEAPSFAAIAAVLLVAAVTSFVAAARWIDRCARGSAREPRLVPAPSVSVLVVVDQEPVPMVRAAVAGALAITAPDRVVIAGRDPRLGAVARDLGVTWLPIEGVRDDAGATLGRLVLRVVADARSTHLAIVSASRVMVADSWWRVIETLPSGVAAVQLLDPEVVADSSGMIDGAAARWWAADVVDRELARGVRGHAAWYVHDSLVSVDAFGSLDAAVAAAGPGSMVASLREAGWETTARLEAGSAPQSMVARAASRQRSVDRALDQLVGRRQERRVSRRGIGSLRRRVDLLLDAAHDRSSVAAAAAVAGLSIAIASWTPRPGLGAVEPEPLLFAVAAMVAGAVLAAIARRCAPTIARPPLAGLRIALARTGIMVRARRAGRRTRRREGDGADGADVAAGHAPGAVARGGGARRAPRVVRLAVWQLVAGVAVLVPAGAMWGRALTASSTPSSLVELIVAAALTIAALCVGATALASVVAGRALDDDIRSVGTVPTSMPVAIAGIRATATEIGPSSMRVRVAVQAARAELPVFERYAAVSVTMLASNDRRLAVRHELEGQILEVGDVLDAARRRDVDLFVRVSAASVGALQRHVASWTEAWAETRSMGAAGRGRHATSVDGERRDASPPARTSFGSSAGRLSPLLRIAAVLAIVAGGVAWVPHAAAPSVGAAAGGVTISVAGPDDVLPGALAPLEVSICSSDTTIDPAVVVAGGEADAASWPGRRPTQRRVNPDGTATDTWTGLGELEPGECHDLTVAASPSTAIGVTTTVELTVIAGGVEVAAATHRLRTVPAVIDLRIGDRPSVAPGADRAEVRAHHDGLGTVVSALLRGDTRVTPFELTVRATPPVAAGGVAEVTLALPNGVEWVACEESTCATPSPRVTPSGSVLTWQLDLLDGTNDVVIRGAIGASSLASVGPASIVAAVRPVVDAAAGTQPAAVGSDPVGEDDAAVDATTSVTGAGVGAWSTSAVPVRVADVVVEHRCGSAACDGATATASGRLTVTTEIRTGAIDGPIAGARLVHWLAPGTQVAATTSGAVRSSSGDTPTLLRELGALDALTTTTFETTFDTTAATWGQALPLRTALVDTDGTEIAATLEVARAAAPDVRLGVVASASGCTEPVVGDDGVAAFGAGDQLCVLLDATLPVAWILAARAVGALDEDDDMVAVEFVAGAPILESIATGASDGSATALVGDVSERRLGDRVAWTLDGAILGDAASRADAAGLDVITFHRVVRVSMDSASGSSIERQVASIRWVDGLGNGVRRASTDHRVIEPAVEAGVDVIGLVREGRTLAADDGVRQLDEVRVRTTIDNDGDQVAISTDGEPRAATRADGTQIADSGEIVAELGLPSWWTCATLDLAAITASAVTMTTKQDDGIPLVATPQPAVRAIECLDDVDRSWLRTSVSSVPAGWSTQIDLGLVVPPGTDAGSTGDLSVRLSEAASPAGGVTTAGSIRGAFATTSIALDTITVTSSLNAPEAVADASVGLTSTLTIPTGTSTHDLRLVIRVPEPFVPTEPGPTVTGAPDATIRSTSDGWEVAVPGEVRAAGGDVEIRFDAVIRADGTSSAFELGADAVVDVDATWGDSGALQQVSTTPPLTITGPDLRSTMVVAGESAMADGATAQAALPVGSAEASVVLEIANDAQASSAYAVRIVHCVPAADGLPIPMPIAPPSSVITTAADGCDGTVLIWRLAGFDATGGFSPGSTAAVGYRLPLAPGLPAGRRTTSTTVVSALGAPGPIDPVQLDANLDASPYRRSSTTELVVPTPTIEVTPAAADVSAGAAVPSEVVVAIPTGVSVADASVLVAVGDGASVAAIDPITPFTLGPGCLAGATAPHDLGDGSVPSSVLGDDSTGRTGGGGWFLGEVASVGLGCRITLTATLGADQDLDPGTALLLGAAIVWDERSVVDDVTELDRVEVAGRSFVVNASPTPLRVVAPDVEIAFTSSDVDGVLDGGQTISQVLTLTNVGTGPAFDVAVEVAVTTGADAFASTVAGVGTCGGTAPVIEANVVRSTVAVGTGLVPGASCTVVIDRTVAPGTDIRDGAAVVDTATVSTWSGAPGGVAERPDEGSRTESLALTLVRPTLTVRLDAGSGSLAGSSEPPTAVVGEAYPWQITVANVSAVPDGGSAGDGRVAHGIDLTLTLPANWSYGGTISASPSRCDVGPVVGVPTAATTDPAAVDVAATAPTVTDPAAIDPAAAADPAAVSGTPAPATPGTTVTWTDLCDLEPGEELVLVVAGTPGLATVLDPGLLDDAGRPILHRASVTLAADDAGGATLGVADDDAAAAFAPADLRMRLTDGGDDDLVDGSAAGTFAVGQLGTYAVQIDNVGRGVAAGPIDLTAVVPAGLVVARAAGEGWSCLAVPPRRPGPTTVGCTRAAALLPGDQLPVVLVEVAVGALAADAGRGDSDPAGGLLTASASVTSRTVDDDGTNDTDDEVTPVVRRSDLEVATSLSPATPFLPGARVDHLVAVTVGGPSPASGPVSVGDAIPNGLRLVGVRGRGWSCGAARTGRTFVAVPEPLTGAATATDNGSFSCTRQLREVPVGTVLDTIVVTTEVDPAQSTPTPLVPVLLHPNDPEPTGGAPASAPSVGLGVVGGTEVGLDLPLEQVVLVTNRGFDPLRAPVAVRFTPGSSLDVVGTAGDGWSCVERPVTVTCTWIGGGVDPTNAPAAGVAPVATLTPLRVTVAAAVVVDEGDAELMERSDVLLTEVTVDGTVVESDERTMRIAAVAELTVDADVETPDTGWSVGGVASLSVDVANRGPVAERGPVDLEVAVPAGLVVTDIDNASEDEGWDCAVADGALAAAPDALRCRFDRTTGLGPNDPLIAVGATLPTLIVELLAESEPVAGATVAGRARGHAGQVSAFDPIDVAIGAASDLSVALTVRPDVSPELAEQLADEGDRDGDLVVAGAAATYTVTVGNAGPSAAPRGTAVIVELPASIVPTATRGDGWTCVPRADERTAIDCTYDRSIAVDSSASFDVLADVDASIGLTGADHRVEVTGVNGDPVRDDQELTGGARVIRLDDPETGTSAEVAPDEAETAPSVAVAGPANPAGPTGDMLPGGLDMVAFTTARVDAGGYVAWRVVLENTSDLPMGGIVVRPADGSTVRGAAPASVRSIEPGATHTVDLVGVLDPAADGALAGVEMLRTEVLLDGTVVDTVDLPVASASPLSGIDPPVERAVSWGVVAAAVIAAITVLVAGRERRGRRGRAPRGQASATAQ